MQLCTTMLNGQAITPTVIASDGFENTPELRQFPNIKDGLTDSTFKMIVLRDGTQSIGISVTLPSGQSGSINWGDGNTTTLTASGAAVNYYHTWSSWQTSNNGLEEYNIVIITGNITAITAIASAVTAPKYWATVLWIAVKSTSLASLKFGDSLTIILSNIMRCDIDAPNVTITNYMFYLSSLLKSFGYNGKYPSDARGIFAYTNVDVTLTNTNAINAQTLLLGARGSSVVINVSTSAATSFAQILQASSVRYFSTNSAFGNFGNAFNGCNILKAIDLTGCPVNGITDATGWTNLWSCLKILFPSTGTGTSRVPKAFASGVTSMGNIDITNSGLNRAALVDMFYSLPTNAVVKNLTITGSVGAAALTTEEIAIATSKNWNVIR